MGFSLFRRFQHDRAGATLSEYIMLTAAASVLLAFFLSFSATFTIERANVIQRALISPNMSGSLIFEDK